MAFCEIMNQPDKQTHFFAGLALACMFGMFIGPAAGFAIACAAGLMKESYDRIEAGKADFLDLAATVAGGAAGCFWMILIHFLLKR